MPSKVRIILQARTSSSRLPAKVLLPIGDMPLAVLCALRLGSSGHKVVLATSREQPDDLLALTAGKAGVKVCRGSLTNVLDRFVQCTADLNDDDIVVRATADNPLPNGGFIDALLQEFNEVGIDYLGTGWPFNGLPYGLSAEIMKVGALRRTSENTKDAYDCEHVTPWLRRQVGAEGAARKVWFLNEDFSRLRATIDTLEDYLAMAAVFGDVEAPVEQDWEMLIPKLPAGEVAVKPIPKIRRDGGDTYGSITLGTAQLGMNYGIANRVGQPSDTETASIIAMAVKSGITHWDTARAYGDSESRIGQLLPASAKANIKIITKLNPLDYIPDDAPEREIESAVDASVYGSCRDLRREQLDILMFHRSADMYRWNGAAIARLESHVKRCVICAVGVSVYTPDEAIKCFSESRVTHIQIPFNLLDQRWLSGNFIEALARRPDVSVHVRSVFLQGLLVNRAEVWPSWVTKRQEFTQYIEAFVTEFGRKSAADLCMAYIRSFPWVSTMVLGVETVSQLDELLSLASEPALSEEQVRTMQAKLIDVPLRLLNPSQW